MSIVGIVKKYPLWLLKLEATAEYLVFLGFDEKTLFPDFDATNLTLSLIVEDRKIDFYICESYDPLAQSTEEAEMLWDELNSDLQELPADHLNILMLDLLDHGRALEIREQLKAHGFATDFDSVPEVIIKVTSDDPKPTFH